VRALVVALATARAVAAEAELVGLAADELAAGLAVALALALAVAVAVPPPAALATPCGDLQAPRARDRAAAPSQCRHRSMRVTLARDSGTLAWSSKTAIKWPLRVFGFTGRAARRRLLERLSSRGYSWPVQRLIQCSLT